LPIDPTIFKAYDIRGLCPEQFSEREAEIIGRAFVEYLDATSIGVGRDMRETSPGLAQSFCRGAASYGTEVVDIGMVTTDTVYFAVPKLGLSGGAMITASHNPKQYNGFKLVREEAIALSGDAGIGEIRQALESGKGKDGSSGGAIVTRDIIDDYVAHVLSFIAPSKLQPFKIVMDAANGMAGPTAKKIFSSLPFDTVEMCFEPDGSFPDHEPNPLVEENRQPVIDRVRAESAALGIAWDGDADRCFFIDEEGEFVPGDFITALLGQAFLLKEAGATVVYDLRASWAVAETLSALGGRPLINRVGHSFFKKRMRAEGAVFGGEVSGHYYFRDNSFADNGMIPALLILELMSVRGETLAEMLAPLRKKYFISGEINSTVQDTESVLERLEAKYSNGVISKLDGLSVDYDDWHFNVRPSNTEPWLRLNLEAREKSLMEDRRDEVLSVIRTESPAD